MLAFSGLISPATSPTAPIVGEKDATKGDGPLTTLLSKSGETNRMNGEIELNPNEKMGKFCNGEVCKRVDMPQFDGSNIHVIHEYANNKEGATFDKDKIVNLNDLEENEELNRSQFEISLKNIKQLENLDPEKEGIPPILIYLKDQKRYIILDGHHRLMADSWWSKGQPGRPENTEQANRNIAEVSILTLPSVNDVGGFTDFLKKQHNMDPKINIFKQHDV